jgi:hypothetical protein
VLAFLDGIDERGRFLQQHEATPVDECFSANRRPLLSLLVGADADGAGGRNTKRQRAQTLVWRLLESPHLFASHARPLGLPAALLQVGG